MIENIMSAVAKHNVTLTMAPTALPASDMAAVCAKFNQDGRTDYEMLPVLIKQQQWAAQSAEFLLSLTNDLCNLLNTRITLAPVRGRPPALVAGAAPRAVRAPTPAPPADGGVVGVAAAQAPPSPVPSSINDPAKLRKCRGCGEMTSHNKATCDKIPCKNCNKHGHIYRDCKEEKKKKEVSVAAPEVFDVDEDINFVLDGHEEEDDDEATSSEEEEDEDSYEEDAKSVKSSKTAKSAKSVKATSSKATSSKAKTPSKTKAAPKAKKAAAPKAKSALKRKREDSDSDDEDTAPTKKGKKAKKVVIDLDDD